MKYSFQRGLIEKAVCDNKIHPTAEDVYLLLKADYPSLSLGTVYRNLNMLTGKGRIRKISLPNAKDRFDGTLDDHYHVFCTSCNNIYDVSLSLLCGLDKEVFEKTGVYVSEHELIIKGICMNCDKKGILTNN